VATVLALVTESGGGVWATLHDPGQHSAVQHFFWMVSWLISFVELLKAECYPECKRAFTCFYSPDRTVLTTKVIYDRLILWCFELC